jgi:hypothetical protein
MSEHRFFEGVTLEKADAKRLALQYFARHHDRTVLIGQISLWIRGSYGLNESEALLEEMVQEGLLQHASVEDLSKHGYQHGYVLTTKGMQATRQV